MYTDFANESIHFYCIKCEYLVAEWIDSFPKSVYSDDSDKGTTIGLLGYRFLSYDLLNITLAYII